MICHKRYLLCARHMVPTMNVERPEGVVLVGAHGGTPRLVVRTFVVFSKGAPPCAPTNACLVEPLSVRDSQCAIGKRQRYRAAGEVGDIAGNAKFKGGGAVATG